MSVDNFENALGWRSKKEHLTPSYASRLSKYRLTIGLDISSTSAAAVMLPRSAISINTCIEVRRSIHFTEIVNNHLSRVKFIHGLATNTVSPDAAHRCLKRKSSWISHALFDDSPLLLLSS